MPGIDDNDYDNQIRNLGKQVERRQEEKVRIARALAENDHLDTLNVAVAEIDAEILDLTSRQYDLEQRKRMQVNRASVEEQIEQVAARMSTKLDDLDDHDYAQLADILQLDLERVDSHKFVGSASIPLPFDGEIGAEGPRQPGLRLPRSDRAAWRESSSPNRGG